MDDFDDYIETIFNEVMNDAFYDNRFINGLYYAYAEIGESPSYTYDLKEIMRRYNKFRDWATGKIDDLIQSVDVVYDENYDDYKEEYDDDDEASARAFEITLEFVLSQWDDDESIKWSMGQLNVNMNKDIDELREHVLEFKDWDEWDASIDHYIESMPTRLIEEIVFK